MSYVKFKAPPLLSKPVLPSVRPLLRVEWFNDLKFKLSLFPIEFEVMCACFLYWPPGCPKFILD